MRLTILALLILVLSTEIHAQVKIENLSGQVSFVSSQNVYVKFKSTSGISAGDTLCVPIEGKPVPALIVINLSSTSCVCTPLNPINLKISDLVIATIKKPEDKNAETVSVIPDKTITVPENTKDSADSGSEKREVKRTIRGSVSLNSYSDLSNTSSENSQRFRYTFSLSAENISNSKFSVESYLSFKHKAGEWDIVRNDIFSALKIYNLAVSYDLNSTTRISLGRRINPRLSSVGAIDGLQAEKRFGRFTAGAVVGLRPDYSNYGFNSDLFQYGAYIAHNSKSEKAGSESSLAFMQQFNQFRTDRRFIYFQHSNSFIKNLYFYSTLEVDLYTLKTDSINGDKPQSTFDLTGLYVSLRYRIFKNLTVSGSYDARKNVVYYETYKTFIDRILETEMRQGFRLQANYRITRDLMFGLQSGYRYLKPDPHPSKNVYVYLTYSNIPGVNISATLSATYLESSHMNGKVAGINLYRDFLKGKVQSGIGYRYVDYRLPENLVDIFQSIGEASMSLQIMRNMSFSVNYEGTYEKQDRYDRIYVQFRKRF